MSTETQIPLTITSSSPAIIVPKSITQTTCSTSATSTIDVRDVSNEITSVIENASSIRLQFVKDFINLLEKDFIKYRNKKHKLIRIKNIIFTTDLSIGVILLITSVILQIIGINNKIISIVLGSLGAFCISFLPIISKSAEVFANKNRNFEHLALNKLNQCKTIFSKIIDDSVITHDEVCEIVKCKNQYENAKDDLKINNQKEVESLFNRNNFNFENKFNMLMSNAAKINEKERLKNISNQPTAPPSLENVIIEGIDGKNNFILTPENIKRLKMNTMPNTIYPNLPPPNYV